MLPTFPIGSAIQVANEGSEPKRLIGLMISLVLQTGNLEFERWSLPGREGLTRDIIGCIMGDVGSSLIHIEDLETGCLGFCCIHLKTISEHPSLASQQTLLRCDNNSVKSPF